LNEIKELKGKQMSDLLLVLDNKTLKLDVHPPEKNHQYNRTNKQQLDDIFRVKLFFTFSSPKT
jgi:hypothetical protein